MQPAVLLTPSALNQLSGLQVTVYVSAHLHGSITVQGQWMKVSRVFPIALPQITHSAAL